MIYLTRGRESGFNSSQLISRDLNYLVELFPVLLQKLDLFSCLY